MNAMATLSEYGAHVWIAYGICALLLVAEMIAVRARLARSERVHDGSTQAGAR